MSEFVHRAFHQRGPIWGRGPGKPWRGIVEYTQALWITWIINACKTLIIKPFDLNVKWHGVSISMDTVQLTFGMRYYWLCPQCDRRCEVVYKNGIEIGCRKCLHLGYLSQSHRPGSALGRLDRIYSRHLQRINGRYYPSETFISEFREIINNFHYELNNHFMWIINSIRIESKNDE
jgi:hypothetical protein